jgi:hypothetical protein
MYNMLKVDQGPFKGGTMFVGSAMFDNDDGLNVLEIGNSTAPGGDRSI